MKRIFRAASVFALAALLGVALLACGSKNDPENPAAPALWASMAEKKLETYAASAYLDAAVEASEQNPSPKNHNSARVAYLNQNGVTPQTLTQNGAKKVTLSLAYSGGETYKARFGYRIDLIEAEEEDDETVVMGHGVEAYGVLNHVDILYHINGTWYDNAYGSTAESGGEKVFGKGYFAETDPKYSENRLAIPLSKDTAPSFASLDFYVVGLEDGFYVLNLFVEREDDAVGHFHGLQVLAATTVVITVGQPEAHEGGHEHEH
ncbi:MAG: hypothetical protein LBH24_05930 [Clostridiales bacterium]|jgi:hypothetical protein|nr:hypothetical protein [Clostridiales bacterium]